MDMNQGFGQGTPSNDDTNLVEAFAWDGFLQNVAYQVAGRDNKNLSDTIIGDGEHLKDSDRFKYGGLIDYLAEALQLGSRFISLEAQTRRNALTDTAVMKAAQQFFVDPNISQKIGSRIKINADNVCSLINTAIIQTRHTRMVSENAVLDTGPVYHFEIARNLRPKLLPDFMARLEKKVLDKISIESPIEASISIRTGLSAESPPLFCAVFNQQTETVRELLSQGHDPDTHDGDGETCLSRAINNQDLEIAKMLLAADANPDACDSKGHPCLFDAVNNEYVECVALLLQYNANPNTCDSDGETCLSRAINDAINTESLEISRMLLAAGANPDDACDNNGRPCLFDAVNDEYVEGVELLLSYGADPNTCDSDGETCLSRAINDENLEISRMLLAAGANPDDACDNSGRPCLFDAVNDEYVEGVELLLGYGADPDACDTDGESCLSRAVFDSNEEIVRLLRQPVQRFFPTSRKNGGDGLGPDMTRRHHLLRGKGDVFAEQNDIELPSGTHPRYRQAVFKAQYLP